MDYKRIYDDFIKDRRRKESGLTGYTERHHILPRSLGGGNEPDNLIRLSAEDHIFAHLLLAKAFGGRLWGALLLMMQPPRQLGIVSRGRRARRIAAIAKEKQALLQLGVSRPDVSVKLTNRPKSERHKRNLSRARMGHKDSDVTRLKKKRAMNDPEVRAKIYTADRSRKISSALTGLVRSVDHCRAISEKAIGRYAGKANPRYDRTVRIFVHDSGVVERLTKWELTEKYRLNRTCLNYVINGERQKTQGWRYLGPVVESGSQYSLDRNVVPYSRGQAGDDRQACGPSGMATG